MYVYFILVPSYFFFSFGQVTSIGLEEGKFLLPIKMGLRPRNSWGNSIEKLENGTRDQILAYCIYRINQNLLK